MEPKIRQIIQACLFGARLWNQSRNETAIAMEHYRRIEAAAAEPPTAETLAFRKRYRRGAKEGMSNDQTSCRYRRFGSIYRRACHGATTNGSGTGDAQEQ
jgi:hypothetical protein